VAPGQLPAERLVHEFRIRASRAGTAVFGVVGRPIAHSVSPAMHNAALASCGIDAVYVPFEAGDFEDFLWAADAFDVMGSSVTAPFKADAYRAAERTDAETARLEVANTLRRSGSGGWSARNTDVEGFLAPLTERAVELAGQRAAVLGAGGAAAAVLAALTSRGADVTVYARRPEAAQRIAARFGVKAASWPPDPGTWDLLVNTTPVGTWPDCDASPVEAPIVHSGVVYDLVYNPQDTALLKQARAAGCSAIGGLEMLVRQAAGQFEWWTGQRAPLEVMQAAAVRRLEDFRRQGSQAAAGER
jgi:shikimate dehydrogenase